MKNKSDKQFLIVLISFIIVSICFLPFFQYHINPDGISYLRISRYYAAGNFRTAVNGYWSPLISWLLSILYKTGLKNLMAFRLLNICIACFVLKEVDVFIRKFCSDIPRSFQLFMLVSCASELLIFHFNTITPDLLVLYLLFFLLNIFLSDEIFQRPYQIGFIGALLYFAKAYSFYFFIVFIIFCAIQKIYGKQFGRQHLWQLFRLVATFTFLCSCWILIMHWKYDKWMISSASEYTFAILDKNGVMHHPFDEQHVLNPLPYAGAYFSWEDIPSVYKQFPSDQIFHKSIFTYIGFGFLNIKKIGLMLFDKYSFLFIALIFAAILCVWRRKNLVIFFQWKPLYRVVIFVGLYVSGYLLLVFEPRYIWILLLISTILLFRLVYILSQDLKENNRNLIGASVIIPFALTTILYLITRINVDKDDYLLAKKIKEIIPAESNIATYQSKDLWNHLFMSDLHNYGGIASYENGELLLNDLNKYKIGYIILLSPEYYQKLPEALKIAFGLSYKDGKILVLKRL